MAEKDGVIAKTEFAKTPLANDVMRFNAEGYINSWSVGWKPKGTKKHNPETGVTVYSNWYLYEYSSVIIPANPDAVNLMLKDASSLSMKSLLVKENEIALLKNDLLRYKESVEKLAKEITSVNLKSDELRRELDEIKSKMKGSVKGVYQNKDKVAGEAISRVFEEVLGRKQ